VETLQESQLFAQLGPSDLHGAGLGLSICEPIVEDHGGWIAARNGAGQGAVFSAGLPISAP
jgi:signal transduction histidine kinase